MMRSLGGANIKRIYFFVLMSLVVILSACSNHTTVNTNSKPIVAVSIVPQEAFVKKIAGDLVEIVTLIPPGNSPANYAPTPQVYEKLSQAKVYYTIGVPTETANILPNTQALYKNLKIVDLSKKVAEVYPDLELAPGKRDPHIWLSPKRVKVMVSTMLQELIIIDPANEDVYQQNAQEFLSELDLLDQDIKNTLKDVSSKSFIIYHPSLAYFAADYKLDMISIEKDGKDATAKDLKSIVDLANSKDIKVVFYQREMDSKKVQTLADEINGIKKEIEPLSFKYIEELKSMANTLANTLNR